MVVRVQKWGNSLAMRVPKAFAVEAGLTEGAPVELAVEDGALVARPIRAPTIRLKQLLARVTPSNRHRVVDLGGATGREAW